MEALSISSLVIIALIVMYFGRAIKSSAEATESIVLFGTDKVDHTMAKSYGAMAKEVGKKPAKFSTRKDYRQALKGASKKDDKSTASAE